MTVQSTRDAYGIGFAFRSLSHLPRPLTALGLSLLVALAPAGGVEAQDLPGIPGNATEESTPSLEPTGAEAIAARRAALSRELRAVDAEMAKADAAGAEHLSEVRERLRSIDSLLQRQAILASPDAGRVDESEAEAPDEVSPYALNALYEAQFAREQAARRLTQELAERRGALASARESFDEAERNRRRASTELEQADDVARGAAERSLRLRELASRVAQEQVYLSTLEVRSAERARDVDVDRAKLAERIEALRQHLARGEGQASAGVSALAQREGELRRSLESLQRLLATAELRLSTAKNRFSQQTEPPPQLLQEVEVLGARSDAIRQEIALAKAQLERLDDQRLVWGRWDQLLRGRFPSDELGAWEVEASDRIHALKEAELRRQDSASDLTRRLEAIEGQLSGLAEDSRLRPAIEEQRDTLRRLHAAMLAEVAALSADRRLTHRLLDDVRDETGHIDFLEYVSRGAGAVRDVWTYEITAVNDSPITVGSLVLALVFFGVGLWASRRGSGFVGRVAEERFRLDAGAAHALQSLSFYALLVAFTLLALRAIHFPLTAFTVLGGALAIGIGFGSQNVMNNFISGLILMLERPVRARDVVEVDGNHGTIERIGARSTQIRATDGRHIVVPNSFFLESNVVNWTLSDDLIRASVLVGVIYGSPTRLVEKLIRQAVDKDDEALEDPEPIVLFQEFGDNSLNFEVHFWVRARSPMGVQRVQSRVRFRIDDLFREHGLVIAFPQRDVHLDSVSPIEVRVLDGDTQPIAGTQAEPETD